MATEKRLIDKEKLLEKLTWLAKAEDQFRQSVICGVMHTIAVTPTVDAVEVVHGRWLYDKGTDKYFCSACNEEAFHTSIDKAVYDYDWEENLRYSHTETIYEGHLTDYCPNCGAKMDGDGNV